MQRSSVACAIALTLVRCGSTTTTEPPPATPATQAVTSSRGTVPDTLRSTIATTLKVDQNKVTPAATFAKDLGADELGMVELVMAYEREFKVRISDAEADRFHQVRDVIDYLQQRNVLR